MRELHARCVKISRVTRDEIPLPHRFHWFFSEKSVGIGSAKDFLECVLSASALSVKPASCHPNEIKN
jgi:hypothetical protein